MTITRQVRSVLRQIVFGPPIPQFCTVGIREPQSDVAVCFKGHHSPIDVTHANVIAAARPFTVGIGLESDLANEPAGGPFSLEFRDQLGDDRILGKIKLSSFGMVRIGDRSLWLFRSIGSTNHCLPKTLTWRRYLDFARDQRRIAKGPHPPEIEMVPDEMQALSTFYICPRPVVLVSVIDDCRCNLFPMDLIGPIGGPYFSFALHRSSTALPMVESSRRIALSSVPAERVNLAYSLGKNHKNSSFEWDQVTFPLTRSSVFGLPVPHFALGVRELEIEEVRPLGSHTLFIGRTVATSARSEGLQLSFVHGFYCARRQQTKPLVAAPRIA
jgi:flavin reductase (DIM6/NTAB) family NADH-FMN oxidoreductase RutF